jgi:hypothetical protein
MLRLVEESSSHACRTGATLSYVSSAGATHDRSFMMALTTVMIRVIRISILKVDQQIDGGDGF